MAARNHYLVEYSFSRGYFPFEPPLFLFRGPPPNHKFLVAPPCGELLAFPPGVSFFSNPSHPVPPAHKRRVLSASLDSFISQFSFYLASPPQLWPLVRGLPKRVKGFSFFQDLETDARSLTTPTLPSQSFEPSIIVPYSQRMLRSVSPISFHPSPSL